MRTWTVPFLALLVGGCAAPAEPTSEVPLTWSGEFQGVTATPGHIHLLLDETGDTWRGTMYFEAKDPAGEQPRVTYRVEGVPEGGVVRVVQKEILEADPLPWGKWCLGTYTLNLSDAATGLAGSYSNDEGRCTGNTSLQPVDEY